MKGHMNHKSPVDSLPGLGPASRQWLGQIGIHTATQLRAADPYTTYAQLKACNPRVGLNMLYALIGAIDGLPWKQIARERRTEILLRLDDMGIAPQCCGQKRSAKVRP